jgi:hypothetical protein
MGASDVVRPGPNVTKTRSKSSSDVGWVRPVNNYQPSNRRAPLCKLGSINFSGFVVGGHPSGAGGGHRLHLGNRNPVRRIVTDSEKSWDTVRQPGVRPPPRSRVQAPRRARPTTCRTRPGACTAVGPTGTVGLRGCPAVQSGHPGLGMHARGSGGGVSPTHFSHSVGKHFGMGDRSRPVTGPAAGLGAPGRCRPPGLPGRPRRPGPWPARSRPATAAP